MPELEDRLREALRRPEAPADFAQRVLARVQAEPVPVRLRPRAPRWLVAATLVPVLASSGWLYHRHLEQKRREAARAKAELLLALQITSEKLNHAFKRIQD